MSRNKWEPAEERVLIDQVKRHPNNLQEAFNQAARILENRTAKACQQRWYRRKNDIEPCFLTIGHCNHNVNRKIITPTTSDNTKAHKASLWSKLISLLKNKLYQYKRK